MSYKLGVFFCQYKLVANPIQFSSIVGSLGWEKYKSQGLWIILAQFSYC